MKLYEYEAKRIFQREGITIPAGYLVRVSPGTDVEPGEISRESVVKAQVPIGARGKAGGIKFASDQEALRKAVAELSGQKIRGYPVKQILVEEKLSIAKELYAGAVFSRANGKIILILSTNGGMEIEEVAAKSPESIHKIEVDILDGPDEAAIKKLCGGIFPDQEVAEKVADVLRKIYHIFTKYDAEIVEINPLVVTPDREVTACDARMSVYDDALPGQSVNIPEIMSREDDTLTELEREARRHGLGYIEMDGDIGVIGNGAGLNLTTLDLLEYVGLKPANFLEVSGRTYDRAEKGLEIILKNKNVRIIFGNFFGCISRCDVIASGLAGAIEKGVLPPAVPLVVAMRGNGGEEGARTLKAAGIEVYEDDQTAINRVLEILKK